MVLRFLGSASVCRLGIVRRVPPRGKIWNGDGAGEALDAWDRVVGLLMAVKLRGYTVTMLDAGAKVEPIHR